MLKQPKAVFSLVRMREFLPKAKNKNEYAIWNDKGNMHYPPYAFSIRCQQNVLKRRDRVFIEYIVSDVEAQCSALKIMLERLMQKETEKTESEQKQRETIVQALSFKLQQELDCWQAIYKKALKFPERKRVRWYLGFIRRFAINDPKNIEPGKPCIYNLSVKQNLSRIYKAFPLRLLTSIKHQCLTLPSNK